MDKPSKEQWRPSASIQTLRERAQIIHQIRRFFNEKGLLEVDTPCLSRHSITDPYLHALSTLHTEPGATKSTKLFMQTSPEYAMKRLLADGSGDIYQISKAFRDDEVGPNHNPEFTLLEWYRLNFSMQDLINESIELVKCVLKVTQVEQYSYVALFEHYCGFDPLSIDYSKLIEKANEFGVADYSDSILAGLALPPLNVSAENKTKQTPHASIEHQADLKNIEVLHKDALLQAIFNQEVESQIGLNVPVVVTHFPASQAALATLSQDGHTANRFEIYFKGLELANGFNELQNRSVQAARFAQDNEKRISLGLAPIPLDKLFLAALEHGLPACSGIALGVDRLVMLALDKHDIKEVVSFNYDNC